MAIRDLVTAPLRHLTSDLALALLAKEAATPAGTHVIFFCASPEVDAASIAGDVEHGNPLQTGQGDGHSVTLKEKIRQAEIFSVRRAPPAVPMAPSNLPANLMSGQKGSQFPHFAVKHSPGPREFKGIRNPRQPLGDVAVLVCKNHCPWDIIAVSRP